MAGGFSIPQGMIPVQLLAPTTTNGGATSRGVNLKWAIRAFIVVDLLQAVGNATQINLRQATAMALGSNAVGPNVPNWKNEDCAASDALTKNTDANSVAVAADVKSKQVIFQVDPAKLAAGSPVVYVTSSNSGQATNLLNVTAYIEPRYASDAPPSLVVD
jgi:hypothetical protein